MSTDSDAHIEDFKRTIEAIVAPLIESPGYCYLAKLGIALGRDKRDAIKSATGLGLSDFIERFMRDKFALVAVGGRKSELVVVPVGKEREFDSRTPSGDQARHPRIARGLWLAFAVPSSGVSRFFNLSQRNFFDGARPEGDEWIEIPPGRLRSPDDEYDTRKIMENLDAWIEENSLSKSDFVERDAMADAVGNTLGQSSKGTSVLDALLQALDKKQLHSISLPLDIVETLLRKRI